MPWDNREHKQQIINDINILYRYETPFPDYDDIAKNPDLVKKFSYEGKDKLNIGLNNIDWDKIDFMLKKYIDEWNPSNDDEKLLFTKNSTYNLSYPELDAFVLYAFIRDVKPKNIIEIGSGQSTRVMIQALLKNNNDCNLTCIEPLTDMEYLKDVYPLNIIKDKLENVDLDLFKTLGENDLLFIDSTHVLKPFGDVEYEYLHILPMLNNGCIVHIHDIFYPYNYPELWLVHWKSVLTEQPILLAFLYGNNNWQIICANHYIQMDKPEIIPEKIENRNAGSFWIKKIN